MNGFSWLDAALVLFALGGFVSFVASIMMLVAGFMVHVGWGLAMLFFPSLAHLAFLITQWPAARRSFAVGLMGVVLMGSGVYIAGRNLRNEAAPTGVLAEWVRPRLASLPFALFPDEPLPPAEAETVILPEADPNLIGRTLDEVVLRHGFPRIRMTVGDVTIYRYRDVEYEAGPDGVVRSETRLDE